MQPGTAQDLNKNEPSVILKGLPVVCGDMSGIAMMFIVRFFESLLNFKEDVDNERGK